MSQINNYLAGAGPGGGTVTSVAGGVGINITGTPTVNPTVNLNVPVVIANGGTNATSFTNTNGVIYFDGTRLISTSVGTAGQVLKSNGAGFPPTFQSGGAGTVLSVTGGTGITITGTSTINPVVNLTVPVAIANGGTNVTSMANTDGVVYFDGTGLSTTTVGTSGQILTSNGAAMAPTFQDAPSPGASTFNTDSGTATVSAGAITIAGAHGINTSGSSATVTVAIDNAITLGDLSSIIGSPAITLTSGDITLTAGNINLPITNTFETEGVITLGGVQFISAYGTHNVFVGQSSGTFVVTGTDNTSLGDQSCASLTTGTGNVGIGSDALTAVDTGELNTVVGTDAASALVGGSGNVIIGYQAGSNYDGSESSNIIIGNSGTLGESHVIRIGVQGSTFLEQNSCYIAGINGVTTSNSQMVTIDSSSSQLGTAPIPIGVPWTVVTTNTSMVSNNGYIANDSGTADLLLPATASVGDIIQVTGINNATGWQITQNSGQTIHFGVFDTTTGTGGSLASTHTRDSIEIVCVIANTDWNVLSSIGNITVV